MTSFTRRRSSVISTPGKRIQKIHLPELVTATQEDGGQVNATPWATQCRMPIIGCMKELASATETFSVLANIWSVTNATARSSRAIIMAFLFLRAQTARRQTL